MPEYEKIFAANLRRMRREQNITQRELAEAAGYSEKTVSKWECAVSIPDIETLFTVARVLHTSVEALFAGQEEFWYLGIDGGGTKTALALADSTGKIVRRLSVGGCNPFDIGVEKSTAILRDAVFEICGDIPLSSVVCFAGIAGGSLGNMRQALAEFFASLHFRAVKNDSDNLNIIAAGLGRRDGITVILGTGICAFVQKNGRHSRVGGWGYLIDNGGSAYNYGRDALHAYYCAIDGSGEATAITAEIEKLSGGEDPQRLLTQLYDGGKKKIASFAPAAFRAAETGDGIAVRILERNIAETAHLIRTAASSFACETVPVVLAGGLTKEKYLCEALRTALGNPERYQLEKLSCEPVEGAVALAARFWKSEMIHEYGIQKGKHHA